MFANLEQGMLGYYLYIDSIAKTGRWHPESKNSYIRMKKDIEFLLRENNVANYLQFKLEIYK